MSKSLNCSVIAVLLTGCALSGRGASGGAVAPAANRPEVCHTAVLRSGFTLGYARREAVSAKTTRLWFCAETGVGYLEISSDHIERFEETEATASPTRAAMGAVGSAADGTPSTKDSIDKLITSAASRHRVDPDFVTSVVKAESGFNPRAVSSKGAQGLMQLMPQTAASLGVHNAFDPAANVEGGTKYLRQLLDQYDGDTLRALAAYNAGPQRVEQYGGLPPFRETLDYVLRVINDYNRKKYAMKAGSRAAPK